MSNLAAIETTAGDIDSHYVIEPIKELANVLSDYIFDGSRDLNITPAQEHVINALLSQIKARCDEILSGQ